MLVIINNRIINIWAGLEPRWVACCTTRCTTRAPSASSPCSPRWWPSRRVSPGASGTAGSLAARPSSPAATRPRRTGPREASPPRRTPQTSSARRPAPPIVGDLGGRHCRQGAAAACCNTVRCAPGPGSVVTLHSPTTDQGCILQRSLGTEQ